jgi:hypothetical protein
MPERGRKPSLEQHIEERLIEIEARIRERAQADVEIIREWRQLRALLVTRTFNEASQAVAS